MSDEDNESVSEAVEPIQDETPADASEADEAQPDDADAPENDETEGDEADADGQSEEDDSQDADADEAEEGKAEPKAADSETVKVEYDGAEFEVPKALEKAIMQQRDYTQKTQAIADERRSISEIKQATAAVGKLTHDELEATVQLTTAQKQYQGISKALDQYSNVDWAAWEMRDYEDFKRGENQYRQLQGQERTARAQVEQLTGLIRETGTKRQQAAQEELTKRTKAISQFAEKSIPGWNAELDSKIGEFAKSELQVDDVWMAQNLTPQVYRTAWLAYVGHQSLNKANQAKPKAAKAGSLKPLSKVKSKTGSSGRKSIEDMSFKEYEAFRKKQSA